LLYIYYLKKCQKVKKLPLARKQKEKRRLFIMDGIWETKIDKKSVINIHLPNGEIVTTDVPVEAEFISKLAKELLIKKFTVKNANGNILVASDFPYEDGDLYIEEYNEAK
jgi:hypothetical protein